MGALSMFCEWDDNESMHLSTERITEVIPPVLMLPANELFNNLKLSTIKLHPHLFCTTTPIKIDWLHFILKSHPNHAVVYLICDGLDSGFWPWVVTNESTVPAIVDNASLQKNLRSSSPCIHETSA